MKKFLYTILAVLLFSVFPFTHVKAEDTVTSTDDTSTTTTDDTSTTSTDDSVTTTSTDDDTTTTADDTTTSTDDTSTTDDTNTEDETLTADTTTEDSSSTDTSSGSFLDNIDTVWLWVVLGIGGVVLIGSLIGIFSLSKKESKEKKVETKPEEEQPKVEVVEDIPSQPVQQQEAAPVQTQPVMTEEPVAPVAPVQQPEPQPTTIQDALGGTSQYAQPEVQNPASPEANIEKDLSDLNNAVQTQTAEPEPTSITGTPEVNIPVQDPTITEPMPIVEPAVPVQAENISTQAPQNQDQILASENTGLDNVNQPINTTSL